MARDIAKHGVNPLERCALVPVGKGKGAKSGYFVAEGNRRLCALKLLDDPDLAPAALRKAFEKLAEKRVPVTHLQAALFPTVPDAKLWLDRLHNGAQGGIGRREWNADQKARSSGSGKNKTALALLDYAEAEKMITAADRKGKLTTVQRFVGNDVFREVLGLDQSDPEEVGRTRPKEEFDIILKRFIRDLVAGKDVNSRMNKDPIIKYARPLNTLPGVTQARVEPEGLATDSDPKAKKPKKAKPKKPEKVRHVQFEDEIFTALKSLGNGKLESLYHSVCTVDLGPHTPLVAVGMWSFFEVLTACGGRNQGTSFDSYLSKAKLAALGVPGDMVTLRAAMERVREYGNTTKHHPVSATFNGDQLNNDVVAMKALILKCIADAASKAT